VHASECGDGDKLAGCLGDGKARKPDIAGDSAQGTSSRNPCIHELNQSRSSHRVRDVCVPGVSAPFRRVKHLFPLIRPPILLLILLLLVGEKCIFSVFSTSQRHRASRIPDLHVDTFPLDFYFFKCTRFEQIPYNPRKKACNAMHLKVEHN